MNKNIYNGFYLHRSSDAENLKNEVLETIRVYGGITVEAYYDLAEKYPIDWIKVPIENEDDIHKIRRILTDYGGGQLLLVDIFKTEDQQIFFEHEEEPEMPNDISNPDYYKSEGIEVIDVIRAFTDGLTDGEAFATGNIIKYACRWKKKNGVADLKKILWYTQYLIDSIKEPEPEGFSTEEKKFVYDIKGLVFESHKKAERAIGAVRDFIRLNGRISITGLANIMLNYTVAGISVETEHGFNPNKNGWTDFSEAFPIPIMTGKWGLCIPKPVSLED